MTRTYSLAIDGESGGFSAWVPELPAILITGRSVEEIRSRAVEAIQLYLEETREGALSAEMLQEIEVELPALR